MEATQEYRAFCRKLHTKHKIPLESTIWIPSLPGNDAYRLGELYERESARWASVTQICQLVGLDQDLLIATVKSIKRWEAHGGLYDRSLCLQITAVRERVPRSLRDKNCEDKYFQSTGRLKYWCASKKKLRRFLPARMLGLGDIQKSTSGEDQMIKDIRKIQKRKVIERKR